MKILLVVSNFFLAEGTIAKGIVKALDEDEVFFFSINEFKYRFDEFKELTQMVDVVHWLFNVGNLDEKYISYFRKPSVPSIATVHHVCPDEMYKVEQASYANIVHVVSLEWLEFLKPFTPRKVLLANLGIDIGKFKELQTNLYSGNGPLKIGMMGFYPGKNNRKRIDIALEVFKSLIERKIEIELVIQGAGWQKSYEEFDKMGLNFNQSKLESEEKYSRFFERIHVYLCTSDIEGGPFPVLEAMASGIPVISTKVGLANDLLEQGGGILCEKGNVESLSDAVILLKNNKSLYDNLSKKAKLVADKYDWHAIKYQYRLLYKETIKSWEKHNTATWKWQNENIIKAKRQREIEQMHNDIRQVRSLLENNNYNDGLRLLITLLFSNKIDFVRKKTLLYRSILFLVKK